MNKVPFRGNKNQVVIADHKKLGKRYVVYKTTANVSCMLVLDCIACHQAKA